MRLELSRVGLQVELANHYTTRGAGYSNTWSFGELPSLPGPLWPEVVAPDKVLSMGQIQLNCVLMLN